MKNLLFAAIVLLPSLLFSMSGEPACDTLILKNGKRMPIKITEITAELVNYERCTDTTTHRFSMPREFVWGVISENPTFHQPVFAEAEAAVAADRAADRAFGKNTAKNFLIAGVVTGIAFAGLMVYAYSTSF